MEGEIEDKLQEIYKFHIDVEWVQFRQYRIIGIIGGESFKFYYIYNAGATPDSNISSICQKIDNEIIKLYRR